MRMRTKLPIVTLVGAGALLLVALAVIFTLRSRTAYAQSEPRIDISIIEMSSDAFYRGATSDVTMEFSYLNNLQDGSNLSYRADIMRIISDFYLNWANDCEGTGLGNIDKSDETNDNNYNFNNNPSGTIDDQDGDGSVEISGQIPATCPTGRYRLTVELWDSSKNDLTSASAEFVVSTDPNATPSAKVELSPPSPVAEGTEIDATITYYDIKKGTRIRFLAQVTKRVGGKDVVEASCHGSRLGQDVSSTVILNPEVHRYVISSSCPAGSYTISGVISTTTGTKIVSGEGDFTVGSPPPSNPPSGGSPGGGSPSGGSPGGGSPSGGSPGGGSPSGGSPGGGSPGGARRVAGRRVAGRRVAGRGRWFTRRRLTGWRYAALGRLLAAPALGAAADTGRAGSGHPAGGHECALGAGADLRRGHDRAAEYAGQDCRHRPRQ